jgi:hypothetical protein
MKTSTRCGGWPRSWKPAASPEVMKEISGKSTSRKSWGG